MNLLRGAQSALEPAGIQAARIAGLTWFLIGVTGIVAAIVAGALVWSLVRGIRRGRDGAASDAAAEEPRVMNVVAASLVATVAVLFAILIASFRVGHLIASGEPTNALTIEVHGHQFWWEVHYADQIPSRRAVTANEIHIPVGRPVVLLVTSRDVIHSFWVPALHGKRDLVPGHTTAIWLQADRAGVFQGQCAEFCGRQHAHMAFTVTAEPEVDFGRWLDRQRAPAAPPASAPAERGRALFMSYRCSGCHSILGTEAHGRLGPDLSHVGSRSTLGAGTLPNTHEALMQWIADPQSPKPGNQMPRHPLPAGDLDALATYLETLQ